MLRIADAAWLDNADYMFLRNTYPAQERLRARTRAAAGALAACCQCSCVSVLGKGDEVTAAGGQGAAAGTPHWYCGGHAE